MPVSFLVKQHLPARPIFQSIHLSMKLKLFSLNIGVMALLRPLLLDNVPSIQQSAALALGRLANYSDELAEAVVSNEILPQLVYSLSEQNVSLILHLIV